MSEQMDPIPSRPDDWASRSTGDGTVFGVHKPATGPAARPCPFSGRRIETPFGPAAGPNTQLAQNIIAGLLRRRPVL